MPAQESEKESITIKEAVEALEAKRHSTVVSYIAREGAFLSPDDCLVLDDNLNSVKPRYAKISKLGLLLHSQGGSLEAADKFVRICREYADEFSVIVPLEAKSAATAICLGADEIVMTAVAELGPIDPIIQHPYQRDVHVPARVIQNFFEFLQRTKEESTLGAPIDPEIQRTLTQSLDPYLIGNYEGALKYSKQVAFELLSQYGLKEKPDEVENAVERFTTYPESHRFVVARARAAEWGLNIVKAEEHHDLLHTIRTLFKVYQAFMAENRIVKLLGTRDVNRYIQEREVAPPKTTAQTTMTWQVGVSTDARSGSSRNARPKCSLRSSRRCRRRGSRCLAWLFLRLTSPEADLAKGF